MQQLPPKKDVALLLIEKSAIYIHLDPRGEHVIVPPGFKKEPRLILQIGHGLVPPIPDLAIEEQGWSATLSFRSVPFRCIVPWTSVFAIVGHDGRMMVWPDDVPPELGQRPARPQAVPAPTPAPVPAPVPAGKPQLAEVSARASAPGDAADAKKEKAKAKRARKKADADKTVVADSARPAETPAPAPPPAAAVPEPAPSASPAPAPVIGTTKSGKPKRELPPYLRVIK